MLVIKRKKGEKVFIGNDISIIVVGIQGNKVSLAIDAPTETLILREELVKKIHANKPDQPNRS